MQPNKDPRPIVDLLAASQTLRKEKVLVKLLRHLANLSYPENYSEARGARELAEALQCSEEHISPNVHRLQQELRKYYMKEGKDASHRLSVHKGGRGPTKVGNNFLVEVIWLGQRPTNMFWGPHLAMQVPVVLVTNAPLFFRHSNGRYRIRVMAVNDKSSQIEHSKAKRQPSLYACEECFHYVSIGDFRLSVALAEYFLDEKARVDTKIVYSTRNLEDPYNPPDQLNLKITNNLVVLGNPRVSWVIDKLQDHIEPNFFIDDREHTRIRNRIPQAEELEYYEDKLARGGHLYAAIIRHKAEGRVQTMVCVQNGPALETLAGVLTDDAKLKVVMDKAGWKDQCPDYFELLFRVALGRQESVRREDLPMLVAWRDVHWRAGRTSEAGVAKKSSARPRQT